MRDMTLEEICFFVAGALDCLVRLYDALGITGKESIVAQFALLRMNDRILGSYNFDTASILHDSYKSKSNTIICMRGYPLDEWRSSFKNIGVEMIKEILYRFQWMDPPDGWILHFVEKLLNRDFR